MVVKFSAIRDQDKYLNDSKLSKKLCPRLILVAGILLFIFVWSLRNFWLVNIKLAENDIISQDLKLNNYEELHKIYKDYLEKNLTVISNQVNASKSQNVIPSQYRVVCYYVTSYNLSRSRQLPPSSVDPYLCTHIIVGFATVQNGTIQPQSPADKEIYKTILSLKNINPELKVLLSVEDFSSAGEFAKVVSSHNLRTKFATNTLSFLNSSGFDGVDLDWEFPSWPDANLVQVRNYTLLLQQFRQLITNDSYSRNYTKFILSLAVAAPELIMRQSYEIEQIANQVDFVNLMSYDYHMYSQYLPITGPNAPLYRRNADAGYLETLNTNWSAVHWAKWGMPQSKINVGIPTYGHSFSLINEDNNGWNAPASGFGKTGDGSGFISYSEACKFINNSGTTHVFDEEYEVPYAYNGYEWVSYDSPISVELKAKYVKNNRFGGAMIYSLNCDDFEGICSVQKFPLTRIVSNILTG